MKQNFNRWLAAAMCAAAMCLGGADALAQGIDTIPDKVFIEDFSIAPGESKLIEVSAENYNCQWYVLLFHLILPEGLELEVINPEEIDSETYTLETIYDIVDQQWVKTPEDQCMMAMSTNLGNPEFMDKLAKNYCEHNKTDYVNYANIAQNQDGSWWVEYQVITGHIRFNSTEKIALLKIHATEELAEEAEIRISPSVFGGQCYIAAFGTETNAQVFGNETVTRVRRIDPQPEMNCDVNGDGNVDIDDVNAVINALLRK